MLKAFARALDFLDEQHALETDAQGLRGAAYVIVPLLSNQADTERVQRALDGAAVEVIEARIGSGTMAEVLMAAAELKPTDFRSRRKRGELPTRPACHPSPPPRRVRKMAKRATWRRYFWTCTR